MVKINLLDLSEDKVIFEKGAVASTTEKAAKDDREFSIESVDELFQASQASKKPQPEKPSTKQEEEPISEKPIQSSSKTPSEVYEESIKSSEEETFNHSPRGKIFFIAGILVVGIAAAFLLYLFVFGEKEKDITPPVADATIEEPKQAPPETESMPAVNQQVLNLYSRNKAKNDYGLNVAQNLMSFSQNDVKFALMVLTPEQIQYSILADSRNALANYQSNMQQQLANMQFRLVNSEEMFTSGETKILADFTLALGGPNTVPPISDFKEIKSGDMQSMLRSLSQKHQLNLQYFKRGQQTKSGQFNQTKYYATLAGNVETLMRFIQEIAEAYPAISFSKIAFNPSNLSTLGKGQITARITLVLNEARMS